MLLRFDPFRDADPFRQLDRAVAARRVPTMPMDAIRREGEIELRFDLPGVDPASIDIEVEGDELRVSAERSQTLHADEQAVVAERRFGSFSRRLTLGDHLDGEHVAASYADGVLVVTVPVAEHAKARKVLVTAGAPALDTTATEAESAN